MLNLFIPACGDRVKLTEDWAFEVYLEKRNLKFAEHRGLLKDGETSKDYWIHENPTAPYHERRLARRETMLKTGTVLEIDRVYIRQQSKAAVEVDQNYDSISFRVVGEKHNRFWVKLADANRIVCERDVTFVERVKSEQR